MKTPTLLGIILIIAGILALAYQGFTYKKREKVLDIGPLHATKDETKTVPLPPVVGGVSLVAGIILVMAGTKKS
jgi:uncharacterized membrane protein HdeD (DUF308 family)